MDKNFITAIMLVSDLLYFVSLAVDGPGHCLGGTNCIPVSISGVKFNFNLNEDEDAPDSVCAELLFKVKE